MEDNQQTKEQIHFISWTGITLFTIPRRRVCTVTLQAKLSPYNLYCFPVTQRRLWSVTTFFTRDRNAINHYVLSVVNARSSSLHPVQAVASRVRSPMRYGSLIHP